MEISLVGRGAGLASPELFSARSFGGSNSTSRLLSRIGQVCAAPVSRKRIRPAIKADLTAFRSEMVGEKQSIIDSNPFVNKSAGAARLFVGLPLDAVSACNTVNHAKAIETGLKALKLLGADGVELPVWWGLVQTGSPDQFSWTGYLALVHMAQEMGLQLRVSLLPGSANPCFPSLPNWVSRLTAANPDLLFAGRSGSRLAGCISFAADELPVLAGNTPLQAYEGFFAAFRCAFADLFGSVITDVTVGLGPDGELRYPSVPNPSKPFAGVGEFLCYDKYMLSDLRRHSEAAGNPLWGLSGPHDVPEHSQTPECGNFFRDHGGSWETPYGHFFLSWYSNILLAHGDGVLATASKVFDGLPVRLSGKVPLVHSWHTSRSRPSQLTAGFYNVDGRDGYDAVAAMFARNSCAMVVPGMDLADREQPQGLQCSPESMVTQIMKACAKHNVPVAGENSSVAGSTTGFNRIKECLSGGNSSTVNLFTYQRMGADFFSPEQWPLFVNFVRSMTHQELEWDDRVVGGEKPVSLPMTATPSATAAAQAPVDDREMQAV